MITYLKIKLMVELMIQLGDLLLLKQIIYSQFKFICLLILVGKKDEIIPFRSTQHLSVNILQQLRLQSLQIYSEHLLIESILAYEILTIV